jgi:hypothetical protein
MAEHERYWQRWHEAYDDPSSRLARRLDVVQRCIREALDRLPEGRVRVVSLCAGEARDLLGALVDHSRAADVAGRLVELDPTLAARAKARTPASIEVACADASTTSAFQGAVPADLVLACGIFGNICDEDIERTVAALPMLCAPRGTVIWTRHPHPPDRTVDIRRWLEEAGFSELRFVREPEVGFAVGAHQLEGPPLPYEPDVRLFDFVGAAKLRRP